MSHTIGLLSQQALIGGEWVDTAQTLQVDAPATGEPLTRIARCQAEEVDAAVQAARKAFAGQLGEWARWSARQRGEWLLRFADVIESQHEQLAALECADTGKPMTQAKGDIAACARYFRFYGGAADKLHGETIPFETDFAVMTLREPYGVCAQIIPWNYPSQIFGRCVAAALAAGNTVVLKPAEDACLSVMRLAALAVNHGLPEGALNVVPGLGVEAGAALASHPGSTTSRLPDRLKPVPAWRSSPPSTMSRLLWSWVASRRSWCLPMPTWKPRCPPWCGASCRMPDRRARRVADCWCSGRSPIRSLRPLPNVLPSCAAMRGSRCRLRPADQRASKTQAGSPPGRRRSRWHSGGGAGAVGAECACRRALCAATGADEHSGGPRRTA